MINKHGLDRYIPEDIAREVRRRCGFGCVVCGASVVEYEHVEPELADTHSHDPDAIALLCGSCHGNATRGTWSKGKVRRALKAPYCRSQRVSWGEFDFGMNFPTVFAGDNLFWRCDVCIAVGPYPLISVRSPEQEGAPFRLSACFLDQSGRPILKIEDNIWRANSQVWDFKHKGRRMTIRTSEGDASLTLLALPGNGLQIERMNLGIGDVLVRVQDGGLKIGQRDGPWQTLTGCQFIDNRVGMQL